MSFRDYKKEMARKREENRILNTIEKNIITFGSRKKEYLEAAKEALRRGDNIAYKSSTMMLKNIMFQLAQAHDMLANFKAARDMREMGSLNVTFTKGMDKVIATLNKSNKRANFTKTRDGFEKAMYNQGEAAKQLRELLSSNNMAFAESVQTVSDISDDDVKRTLEAEIRTEYREADTLLDALEDAFMKDSATENSDEKEKVAIPMGDKEGKSPALTEARKPVVKPSPETSTAITSDEIDETVTEVIAKVEKVEEALDKTAKKTVFVTDASKEAESVVAESAKTPVVPEVKRVEHPASEIKKVEVANPNAKKEAKEEKVKQPEDVVLEGGGGKESEEFKFNWDELPETTFDDVAGLKEVKETVNVEVLMPLKHPEAFEGYEIKKGGGLLLYGPPGTGKTMIAAAIANEIGAKFCSVQPSDLLHQGVGQSEKAVKALFAQARQFPCAVIYFDEMDSISPKNTRSQYSKHLRSELLAQIQGMDSYREDDGKILFLIAATNKPWDIDSAFIRPGRFGTRVYVGLPDAPARRYIVEHRLEKIKAKGLVEVCDDIDVDAIVEKTEGYNGADITNLISLVEKASVRRNIEEGVKKYISMSDFDTAFEKTTSSVQRSDIEKLMEWKAENK